MGFGGPLNIKFKILLYEKSVLGLHDGVGWRQRQNVRWISHNTLHMFRDVTHMFRDVTHMFFGVRWICLELFFSVTHMFRASVEPYTCGDTHEFQIWRPQRDLDAHLLHEKIV